MPQNKSVRTSTLALYGGPKAVPEIQTEALRWPRIDREELALVNNLVRRGQLSFSEYTQRLEHDFANFIDAKYTLACNNGTAAGHSCFFAVDIQPGDEVICPSFTFWASIVQVLQLGGIPVFCDIDEKTLNLDPKDVERQVTRRTKAILVVHMLGMPADMDAILDIARRHKLRVIEDCSHAHGAAYRGKRVGTFGDASFFSFQTSKLLPAGEGGMFVTNRKSYYERAIALGHYERLTSISSRYSKYRHTCFGFKYRIHPVAAAIAYCQLKRLKETNARICSNMARFLKGLQSLQLWNVPAIPQGIERVYYENWLRWRPENAHGLSKELFMLALQAEGCVIMDARYEVLHQQPIFREPSLYQTGGIFPAFFSLPVKPLSRRPLPNSERIRQELIHVPTFPGAKPELVDRYLNAFRKVEENLEELSQNGTPKEVNRCHRSKGYNC